MKLKNMAYKDLISPSLIPELQIFNVEEDGITIGASVPLNDLKTRLADLKHKLPKEQTFGIRSVLYQLKWFAGNQIRNMACVGGNIATASPISDLNPVWIATNTSVTLRSHKDGERTVLLRNFFVAYRKTVMRPDEVIISIKQPFSRSNEYIRAYKQARRKEDDIAIVTCCFRVQVDPVSGLVTDSGLAFGGMAAKSVFAEKAEKALLGKKIRVRRYFRRSFGSNCRRCTFNTRRCWRHGGL